MVGDKIDTEAPHYAPVLFGCAGLELSRSEKDFFKSTQPAGFILFKRNIDTPEQVIGLIEGLREATGRDDLLVFTDQEGGRVQRFNAPHWPKYLPFQTIAGLYSQDPAAAKTLVAAHVRRMALDLVRLNITGNCIPVLDIPVDGADPIIGDRALGFDADTVATLGQVAVDAALQAGILPVIKHIPGHGRAMVDSHLALPQVDEPLDVLKARDFSPFQRVKDAPFAMTAHIVYSAIDSELPATLSPTVVQEIIRTHIGYKGLLMTDDLSMKALSGTLQHIGLQALSAGCDLLLHCNGDMAEMKAVMAGINAYPSADAISARVTKQIVGALEGISSAALEVENEADDIISHYKLLMDAHGLAAN